MTSFNPPAQPRSGSLRDFELESIPLGPATRILTLEADPTGGLYFQFRQRKARSLQLPESYSLRYLTIIDRVNATAVIDPRNNRLAGFAGYLGIGTRMMLFEPYWGKWVDEHGILTTDRDILTRREQWKLPLSINSKTHEFSFDFSINIYNHRAFTREAFSLFRDSLGNHSLKLHFNYPSGNFSHAQLIIQEAQGSRISEVHDIQSFPIALPKIPILSDGGQLSNGKPEPKPKATPRPEPVREQPRVQSTPKPEPKAEPKPAPKPTPGFTHRPAMPRPASSTTAQARPDEPKKNEPIVVPKTQYLSSMELIRMLGNIQDKQRRWLIIADNLQLGRPERTYPLLVNHGDLIAKHVREWPGARLKSVFGSQPALALMPILQRLYLNQVFAIAEEHAERERILDWLREHEVERMLRLDTSGEIVTVQQARDALWVDERADTAQIKKIWRKLLGFLNADHGRSQEHAIHRRKDEIAKFLQDARNRLIKK